MRAQHLHRRSVLGRVLKTAYAILLVAVAAAAILVGGAAMVLQTKWGAEAAKRLVLPRLNARIAGQLALGRVGFGGARLTLDDLELRDPQGQAIVTIDRLELAFAPWALFRRHLEIEELAIRHPRIRLVEDHDGLNLTRAIATRTPSRSRTRAPATADGPGWTIEVRGWEITGGSLDWVRTAGAPPVRVVELTSFGGLRYASDQARLTSTLELPGIRLDLRGAVGLAQGSVHALDADLRASLPGATVTAHLAGSTKAIDARLQTAVTDLAALARRLEPILSAESGAPLPAIEGHGQIEATLSGRAANPHLRLVVTVPSLRVGQNNLRQLDAEVMIPDLRTPEAFDADLGIASSSFAGHRFRAAALSVSALGRQLAFSARVTGPEPLSLDVRGRRESRRRAIVLDRIELRTPEASWSLVRPARLELGPRRFALTDLALVSAGQRVELDLARTAEAKPRTTGRIAVKRIDLARLPRALLPPGRRLAGLVDAELRLEAAGPRPRFQATAVVKGGRIGGLGDLGLRAQVDVARGRARGRLEAAGLGTSLRAGFDLPARWPIPRGREPLAIAVALADTDLGPASAALASVLGARPPGLQGRARLSARLEGSVEAPALALDVRGQHLALRGRPLGDLALEARADGDHPARAQLTATGPPASRGARLQIALETPLSLRALLRRPPTRAALARTPITATGTIDRLPLAPLVPAVPRLGGTLSCRLAISGTIGAPTGTVSLDVTGAATARFPPTDAHLDLALDENAVRLNARVLRQGHPLLVTEGRLDGGWRLFRGDATITGAPLRVRANFGPFTIRRHDLELSDDHGHARALQAIVRAELTVDGSLRAPRAGVEAEADGIRLDRAPVGTAHLVAKYAEHQAELDARLVSANGGSLQATANAPIDLGYPNLGRGLDRSRLPLQARLDARGFELEGFSGFVPALRTLGGRLDASLQAHGTLAEPRFQGKLHWNAGTLAISGVGDYHDIDLALHGDDQRLVVDKLTAKSGSGQAQLSGEISRIGGREQSLAAEADLTAFPIYVEGQPVAKVSLKATVSEKPTQSAATIAVDLREGQVELADEDRRDLQPLKRPRDIVIVENGAPRGRAEKDKLRALEIATPGVSGPAARSEVAPPPPTRVAKPLHVTLHAENRFWISGRDARIEVGLSPNFRVEVGRPTQIFGQVTIQRGRIDVLGRRFDLKADSTVKWTGSPDRPELDVTAQYDDRDDNVSVVVNVKGAPGQTTIAVSSPSRPDLTESQLYTLIIAGRLQGVGGTATTGSFSASSEAASLAGGLVAAGLQKALARSLPLDVLTIESANNNGVLGTQVEAGRYVTDRLYLGYLGRVGADPTRYQNRNAVHAEYRLSSRWQIEAEYGDVGTGSADVTWKKNY